MYIQLNLWYTLITTIRKLISIILYVTKKEKKENIKVNNNILIKNVNLFKESIQNMSL